MNIKQKVALIGFFIGLFMVASMSIYNNRYTMVVVMLGSVISLTCALAYSIFQYYPLSTKEPIKNCEPKESTISTNVVDLVSDIFKSNEFLIPYTPNERWSNPSFKMQNYNDYVNLYSLELSQRKWEIPKKEEKTLTGFIRVKKTTNPKFKELFSEMDKTYEKDYRKNHLISPPLSKST